MVLILFFILLCFTIGAWKFSRYKFFSPTLWASGMFLFYDTVYLLTYNTMLSDISPKTLIVIISSLTVTALGEYSAYKIKSQRSINESITHSIYWDCKEIVISKTKVYIMSIVFLLIAISRFRNLINIVKESGVVSGRSSFFIIMGAARQILVNSAGKIKLGNFFANQLVYVSEIVTYFCIFVFLYDLIICKKKHLYLLVPLIPDFLMRLVSTNRTSFLMLFLAFIVLYFMIQQKNPKNKRIKIPIWLIIAGGVFVILFLWYGISRNDVAYIPLVDYLQMYTCSAIYDLDYSLVNGWTPNIDFGFNTLNYIYELLNIPMKQEIKWGTGMLVFNKNGFHSNIYTSILATVQDFGYFVMLVLRTIEAFIATKVIGFVYNSKENSKQLYISLYFALMSIYCYFYYSTGNVFPAFFAQPDVMIRYFLYGWLFLVWINPKGVNFRGNIINYIFKYYK